MKVKWIGVLLFVLVSVALYWRIQAAPPGPAIVNSSKASARPATEMSPAGPPTQGRVAERQMLTDDATAIVSGTPSDGGSIISTSEGNIQGQLVPPQINEELSPEPIATSSASPI